MATVTLHQWSDPAQGLREMRRVARDRAVIMTFDPTVLDRFWLADYASEMVAVERRRFPTLAWIAGTLGGTATVASLPIPRDCADGFAEAYYARPERLLDPAVRRGQSWWSFLGPGVEARVDALAADLASGEWHRRRATSPPARRSTDACGCLTARPA
jgi:hypothetical protein